MGYKSTYPFPNLDVATSFSHQLSICPITETICMDVISYAHWVFNFFAFTKTLPIRSLWSSIIVSETLMGWWWWRFHWTSCSCRISYHEIHAYTWSCFVLLQKHKGIHLLSRVFKHFFLINLLTTKTPLLPFRLMFFLVQFPGKVNISL